MELKAWNAVKIIIEKGLHPIIIESWCRQNEIPEKFVEMPMRRANGGYYPLVHTGFTCAMMAKPHELAILYDNTGKMYYIDGVYERIMAYYCFMFDPIPVEEIKAVLREGRVAIDFNDNKLVYQLAKNFKKSHPLYVRNISKKNIPRLATPECPFVLSDENGNRWSFDHDFEEKIIKRCWKSYYTAAAIMFDGELEEQPYLMMRFAQCHGWDIIGERFVNPWAKFWCLLNCMLLMITAPMIIHYFFFSLINDREYLGAWTPALCLGMIWFVWAKTWYCNFHTCHYTFK